MRDSVELPIRGRNSKVLKVDELSDDGPRVVSKIDRVTHEGGRTEDVKAGNQGRRAFRWFGRRKREA